MRRKQKAKCAARFSVKAAPKMTKKGRAEIACWLERQARMLRKHGKDYTDGWFTARWLYR